MLKRIILKQREDKEICTCIRSQLAFYINNFLNPIANAQSRHDC